MIMQRTQFLVEGLSAFKAVDKLSKGGVEVLYARKTQKNGVFIDVKSKDVKKAFAILRASCYNVKKVRFRGLTLFYRRYTRRVGLLLGAVLFFFTIQFAQSRVLKIEVTGSGVCYDAEVRHILREAGIGERAGYISDVSAVQEKILSLPRVSYCNLQRSGGILTVEVQVSDDDTPLFTQPLAAKWGGVVQSVTAVRGRACVAVGDTVVAGDTLVDCILEDGSSVLVIASVRIAFCERADFSAVDEENALEQARLQFAGADEISVAQEGDGWNVVGCYVAALNFV